VGKEYVGIDLHRRRSVIVRKDASGKLLESVQIDNNPIALAEVVTRAGEAPEVVLEATYGWYWAADVLAELGANTHLAHPLGNNWGNRRVKNDERDAADLVDFARASRAGVGKNVVSRGSGWLQRQGPRGRPLCYRSYNGPRPGSSAAARTEKWTNPCSRCPPSHQAVAPPAPATADT
jgi:hypothetical protein